MIVGKCDGLGPVIPQFDGNVTDDTMAYFSNFEPLAKVAVLGFKYLLYLQRHRLHNREWTSMAAPRVAGAAALYKAVFSDVTPDKVIAEIAAINVAPHTPCDGGPRGYFTGKTDGVKEPLLFQSLLPP